MRHRRGAVGDAGRFDEQMRLSRRCSMESSRRRRAASCSPSPPRPFRDPDAVVVHRSDPIWSRLQADVRPAIVDRTERADIKQRREEELVCRRGGQRKIEVRQPLTRHCPSLNLINPRRSLPPSHLLPYRYCPLFPRFPNLSPPPAHPPALVGSGCSTVSLHSMRCPSRTCIF